MSKKGYILRRMVDAYQHEDIRWMKEFGCVHITTEEIENEKFRPAFKQMIMTLGRGDEVVVTRCSHVFRNLTDMSLFISLCYQKSIRFVSIYDRIDTDNELFPDTSGIDVLKLFYTFPLEVKKLRSDNGIVTFEEKPEEKQFKHPESRKEREMLVINMYNDGYSLQDIWFTTGFKRTCDIYRILNRYNITPNRKIKDRAKRLQHPVLASDNQQQYEIS